MSAPFSVADAVRWSGGQLQRGDASTRITGVCIDSRAVGAGDLFVAIVGEKNDAHAFLEQAVGLGAAGLLVADGHHPDVNVPVICAPDTTAALGALAAGHRAGFTGTVVGITGSSGKTTTKEMCAAVLSAAGPCLKTEGNLNNEFGLPLSLLRRETEHERAVIELGMNHRGEIAQLAEILRPDVAVVTNIGVAHIEFLGSLEEIGREKGDLYAALGADGIAVANRDDPLASEQAARAPGRALGYASTPGTPAEVRAEDVHFLERGAYAFRLVTTSGAGLTKPGDLPVEVAGLGQTTVINALAAASAGLAAGISLDDVARGLAMYRPLGGRMAPYPLASGGTLIDDSYNANPGSMRASLEALAGLAEREGRAFAVLGDMGELGAQADRAHRETGRWVAELGIEYLVALGERAGLVVSSAIDAGMPPDRARTVADHAEAAGVIEAGVREHDWVLVKGSRAMKLERLVETLRTEAR